MSVAYGTRCTEKAGNGNTATIDMPTTPANWGVTISLRTRSGALRGRPSCSCGWIRCGLIASAAPPTRSEKARPAAIKAFLQPAMRITLFRRGAKTSAPMPIPDATTASATPLRARLLKCCWTVDTGTETVAPAPIPATISNICNCGRVEMWLHAMIAGPAMKALPRRTNRGWYLSASRPATMADKPWAIASPV